MFSTPKGSVRTPSSAVIAMGQGWPLVDALLGGTAAMREAGQTYLPQWPNEGDKSYKLRLHSATLFPAFARTVEVLAGKPFSKPVSLSKDVPTQLAEWCGNIDLQGRNLHSFAANLCQSALSHGIGGILIDHPPAQELRTKADEAAAGVRPYWVEITANNLLGWRSKRISGAEVLTQLRFLESVEEPDGNFGEILIEQVRVLYPGKWEIWRENKASIAEDKWELHLEGVTSLPVIPFVPVYGKRTGFMRGTPPMMELAHINVEHWQSKSDQQTILHVARVPILFAKMLGDAPIVVGAASAVTGPDEHSDLKFVEHSGAAIEAGRKSLLDLEDRMRQVGAELLVIKPGNTTVSQTLSDNEPGMCVLQRITQDLEGAIDAALQLTAEWVGLPDGGHAQVYQDFGVSSLAEGSLELLRGMNIDGTFSDESLFNEAQRRGVISADAKWPEEKLRIAQNRPREAQVQEKITD